MDDTYMALLRQLGNEYGVWASYVAIDTKTYYTTEDTYRRLLTALGVRCNTIDEARQSLRELERARWQEVIEPVLVQRVDRLPAAVRIRVPHASIDSGTLEWWLRMEDGRDHKGEIALRELQQIEAGEIDGVPYVRLEYPLPYEPPLGYHELDIRVTGVRELLEGTMCFIVVPVRCYLPKSVREGRSLTGVSMQVGSLRSRRNWGVGMLSDVGTLVAGLAMRNVALVGINPLHVSEPRCDGYLSPYMASSRLHTNPIHIDVERAARRLRAVSLLESIAETPFQDLLDRLRETKTIQRPLAGQTIFAGLERLWAEFRVIHIAEGTPEAREFEEFCDARGRRLYLYAVFAALREHFFPADLRLWGWHLWDAKFHDPEGPAVKEFAADHADRVRFYQFVEWLGRHDVRVLQKQCKDAGMEVGLYLDIALGSSMGGADSWIDQKCYVRGVGAGAPPDPLGPQGQAWGLPPYHPRRLRAARYAPVIELYRYTMCDAGAVREDHFAHKFRLYWIPDGCPASEGAYVSAFMDELAGIMALESVRHECMVIGEDLGTIPPELRAMMAERNVLSYRVQRFEQDWDKGEFLDPATYPANAATCALTHDLSQNRPFWNGTDIDTRVRLKLHPPEAIHDMRTQRLRERRALLNLGVRNAVFDGRRVEEYLRDPDLPLDVLLGMHRLLALTRCWVRMAAISDATGMVDQENMPGTSEEDYPNWAFKQGIDVEDMWTHSHLDAILRAMIA